MLSTNARFDDDDDAEDALSSCKTRALLLIDAVDRDESEDEEDELAEESAEEMCRSAVSDSVCALFRLSTS